MNKSTERIIENIQYNIFSDVEVSNLFSGSANSRYGLIKRAARAGYIHYIRRGLYSLAVKYQHHKILEIKRTAKHRPFFCAGGA